MQRFRDVEQQATSRLHERLSGSRVGMRWERILRSHAHELDAILVVHADVHANVIDALWLFTSSTDLDQPTVAAIERVLDDFERLGGVALQRDIEGLRDELIMARGHNLEKLLAG